jgi:hypothetical protein
MYNPLKVNTAQYTFIEEARLSHDTQSGGRRIQKIYAYELRYSTEYNSTTAQTT